MKAKGNTYITEVDKDKGNINKTLETEAQEKVDELRDTAYLSGGGETKTTLNPLKSLSSTKYLKNHTEDFNNTRDSFLAYIINDQTKFADFNKIDGFYRDNIVELVTKLNVQNIALNEKKAKLKQVEDSIQRVYFLILNINNFVVCVFYFTIRQK